MAVGVGVFIITMPFLVTGDTVTQTIPRPATGTRYRIPPERYKGCFVIGEIQTAELTFGFLEAEFGMAIVKRHYHQEGNFIVYEGPTWSFSIECAPDWNSMSAWVTFDPSSSLTSGPIEAVLAQSEPETDWRFHGDSGPVDRAAVIRTMDLWARGLRDYIGSGAGPAPTSLCP